MPGLLESEISDSASQSASGARAWWAGSLLLDRATAAIERAVERGHAEEEKVNLAVEAVEAPRARAHLGLSSSLARIYQLLAIFFGRRRFIVAVWFIVVYFL